MRGGCARALVLLVAALVCAQADARPERIRPGMSYYSDESETSGHVRDIVGEKNYEEVYQRYTYFEVVYDEQERVVVWKEYRRGDVIHVERYRYDETGRLGERRVERPGKPAKVTTFGADGEATKPAP